MAIDYSYIIDHLPQPVLLVDIPTFRIINANSCALELYGYSYDEILQLTTLDLLPKEDIQKYLFHHQKRLHQIEVESSKWRHCTKSGKIFYVNTKSNKVDLEDGKSIRVVIVEDISAQVNQEREIASREYLLSSLIDSQSSYLIRTDLDGKYSFVNTVFFEKYGLHQALLGVAFTNTVVPDEQETILECFQNSLSKPGEIQTAIVSMPLAGGVLSWVEWEFTAVKNQEGKIEELQGVGRDITQRKYIEDQLITNQEQLNSMMQSMQIGVVQVGLDGKVQFVNQMAANILERSIEEILGNDFLDNSNWETIDINFSTVPKEHSSIRQVFKDKKPLSNLEYGILNKETNEIKWLSSNVTPLLDEYKKLTGVLVNFSDITEMKDTELKLKRSYQDITNFKQALENSTILSITNLRGEILEINEEFLIVTKYKRDEILRKDHNILNSDYHGKGFFKEMWQTIKEGKTWRGQIRNTAKDGSIYWIDCIINPIRDENNRVYRYLSIGYLITERKLAELRLKELNEGLRNRNKQLLDFAFVTSHELRRPLANIMGLVELFNHEDLSDQFNAEIIEKIEQSANELDAVAHDMNRALHKQELTKK